MDNHWIKVRETKTLSLWLIDDGERWWYAASSKKRALEMHSVEIDDDDMEGISIEKVPSEKIVIVRDEDSGMSVAKTAAEWAADGEGLVASTIF